MNTKDMKPRERRWWKRVMRKEVRRAGGRVTYRQLCDEPKPYIEAFFAVLSGDASARQRATLKWDRPRKSQ